MGNLQDKFLAVRIPHYEVALFWEAFVKRFFELQTNNEKNKRIDKSTKIILQSVARRLSGVSFDSKTFPFEIIYAEEHNKENQGESSLFAKVSSDNDRVGIFLNSLSFALQLNPNLSSLILRNCSLQYLEQVQFISHRILPKIGSILQILDLSGNQTIGNNIKCISGLVESLQQNCIESLNQLFLNDTCLGDEGVNMVSSFIENAKRISTVQLNKNDITEAGFATLLKSVKKNARVTDLQVKYNSIGKKSLLQLKSTLTRNSCISEIISELIFGKPMLGTGKARQFSIKMKHFNASMRARTNSDADARQVPVFKWFAEGKSENSPKDNRSKITFEHNIQTKNSRLIVGSASSIGKRPNMEDVTLLKPNFRHENEDLYIVLDGHGGKDCAEYAAKHLPSRMVENIEKYGNPYKAFQETFLSINKEMSGWAIYSGTTVCAALFLDEKLYIANVGDTRAVMCKTGQSVRLSLDHNLKVEDEIERITKLGGVIENGRLQGMIAVTRSMGDSMLQPYLIADPYISTTIINMECEYMIIACDGLWDVISDDLAISTIRSICLDEKNPEKAAEILKTYALDNGSEDNVSIVVILFNHQRHFTL